MNRKAYSNLLRKAAICMAICLCHCVGWTQGTSVYVNTMNFSTGDKTSLYIPGNLHVDTATHIFKNEGQIFLRDSLINKRANLFFESSNPYLANDSMSTNGPRGSVVFFGGKAQAIKTKPGDTVLFCTLKTINNSKVVVKNQGFTVLGPLDLQYGKVDLELHNIHLFYPGKYRRSTGFLSNENNRNNVFDSKYKSDTAGYDRFSGLVRGLFSSNAITTEPIRLQSMGLDIQSFSSIYVDRGHVSLPNAGDGGIRKFFTITPASGSSSRVNDKMSITYLDSADISGLGFTESRLGFYRKDPTSNVTYYNLGGVVDSFSNRIDLTNPTFATWTISNNNCKNPPVVKFASGQIDVCLNTPLTISGTLTNDNSSASKDYEWYRTIGFITDTLHNNALKLTDTLKSNTPAVYRIKVTDNRGCYSYTEMKVVPHFNPKATISGVNTGGYCLYESLSLTDTAKFTDASIAKRIWYFDFDTVCRVNANYQYTTPGTKTVTLYVESNFGCSDKVSKNVLVHASPLATIKAIQTCTSLQVNFSVTKLDAETYHSVKWDFGDSTKISYGPMDDDVLIPTLHPYSSTGDRDVSLVVETSAGCKDTIHQNVVVHQSNKLDFSADNNCLGVKTNFVNLSQVYGGSATYLWTFGDGNSFSGITPNKYYNLAQTYDVTLSQTAGSCNDFITKQVTIYPLPDATFAVANGCLGTDITFSPTVVNSTFTYAWTINGQSFATAEVTKSFATPGTYPVTLTVTNGNNCSATTTKTFTVYDKPVANFTYQPVCFGVATPFYNQSAISGGSLTYLWDFGNDETATVKDPSYSFLDGAGTKTVKFVTVSNMGCRDSITKSVEVYYIPHADLLNVYPTCGSSYVVDATVFSPDYTVTSYQWSTGVRTPTLTITRSNYAYTVTLTTDKGCSSTATTSVSLNTSVKIQLPSDTAFCGVGSLNSHYPDATWEYLQDISAVPVSLGTSAIVDVSQSGIYRVSVVDQNNCAGSASVNAVIHSIPVVNLGPDMAVCKGTEVLLDGGPDGSTYSWNKVAGVRYLKVVQNGKYSVTVTNTYGCVASDDIYVSFLALPTRNLQNVTACNVATLDAGNAGASYMWNTGATTRTIRVTGSGIYSVVITNGNNCLINDTAIARINLADAVNLGADRSACEGDTVFLDAGVHSAAYSYTWNGKTTMKSKLSVTGRGSYVVVLTNTENLCTAGDTVNISFKARPVVNLGNDRTLCNNTDIALDAGNSGSLIQWNSSLGNTYTQQVITVNKSGKYWATVVNADGCMGRDTIEIFPSPETLTAEFVAASSAYTGDSIRFVNLSYPEPYTSKWRFGDGVTSTEESTYHNFYMVDTFHVVLTVASGSCSETVTKPIVIARGFKSKKVDITIASETLVELLHSNLYPNPCQGNFAFEFQLSKAVNIQIYVYNLQGRMILHEQFKNTDLISKSYSLNYLPQGIYLFRVNYGNNFKTYKVVKY